VRVSLCPSAMHASLRLISAAERLCLPNRPFVRDRLILLLLPTMRRVRSTFLLSFPKVISGMARTTMMLPKSLMNSPALWDLFPWPRTTLLKFSPIFKRELCAASQQDSRVHVCFGSKADMCSAKGHVRFTPESGHVRSARDVRFGPIADIYSITSSAMERIPAGMVRPSALAVLRLITSSNFVGCNIGKSAAFSPLRTRPTYTPTKWYISVRRLA